jgi:SAM-dependent methyltransferase
MDINFLMHPISLRRDLHEQFKRLFEQYMLPDAVVYDVGCGQKPFRDFLEGKVRKHIGVDLADGFYTPDEVDLIGTAYNVPAANGIADAVILSQVIEHLESPLLAMQEVHRLLKPEGLVFLSFPFLYPMHAVPRDYLRFTEFYLSDKIADTSFEVIETLRLGGYWYLMGIYTAMYLKDMDRGVLKVTRLVKLVSWVLGLLCLVLHNMEGILLRVAEKNVASIRARWTINYVTVLRKKGVKRQF